MGIPSYFSYIVKNHPELIQKLCKGTMSIHNLYMDCNSIIYDAVRNIDFNTITDSATRSIIHRVQQTIEEYIALISPTDTVMIAFDGVAPVAKLEQQRNRRYKSWYQNEISKAIFKKPAGNDPWNTTAITPGTEFMRELGEMIKNHFHDASIYRLRKLIISTSDEVGEGEHKIFDYIRNNQQDHLEKTSIVYGLDADLIMLSINHLPISERIFLFRETPEFIKSISAELEPNETYILDIPELAKVITLDMNNQVELTTQEQKNRVYDYIFLCFFLGNDFMPHFPALNIRTGGVDKMLQAYKATLGNTRNNLTDGSTIYWKHVRTLVSFLAEQETQFIQSELKLRDKRERRNLPSDTSEQKYTKFDALPTYERELEKYIQPGKDGWRARYYKSLFKMKITEERCKEICVNYLEGLEWTMKYYTSGCPDWRWYYKYNYPPLLQDLIRYIPYFETTFIKATNIRAVSPLVQLCYVLPKHSLAFLPEPLYKALTRDHSDKYPVDCEFTWAFCKYFWESHVELPEMDVTELETYVQTII